MEITLSLLLQRYAQTLTRAVTVLGPLFFIFWIWKPGFLHKYRLPLIIPKKNIFFQEFLYSFIGLGVYLIPFVTLIYLKKEFGYSQMYTDIAEYGYGYIALTVFIFIVFTDTYSYWTHRLQHRIKALKSTHIVHHKSINISPLTSYSFSFIDAVINMSALFILLLTIPWHPLSYLIYGVFGIFHSGYLHLGYDLPIDWQRKIPILKWHYTSTHHFLHHQKFECNYGQYFVFWDRLMKTEDVDLTPPKV